MATTIEMTNRKSEAVSDRASTTFADATESSSGLAEGLVDPNHANRVRLSMALERMKATGQKLREKTTAGAKATDHCIREHPYQTIGVAFVLGLAVGLLRRRAHKESPGASERV
jgi:ElaB/YqjD/DUF883 family membrane-anchored ribosome-binding protein